MPRVDSTVSSSAASSRTPRHPSRKPRSWSPYVVDALAHDRADDGVQPGTVATAGEHADPHGPDPTRPPPTNRPPGSAGRLSRLGEVHACSTPGDRRAESAVTAAAAGGAGRGGARRSPSAEDGARSGVRRLTAPLGGRPFRVSSADGTSLYAEAFGAEPIPRALRSCSPTAGPRSWASRDRSSGAWRAAGLRLVAYDLRGHGRSTPSAAARLRAGPLRRGRRRDGASRRCRRSAGDRRGPLAGRHVDRGVGAARRPGRAGAGGGARQHGSRRSPRRPSAVRRAGRILNHPATSRAIMGSRLRVPPFSSPLQQALIRYVAFGPAATPARWRSTSAC